MDATYLNSQADGTHGGATDPHLLCAVIAVTSAFLHVVWELGLSIVVVWLLVVCNCLMPDLIILHTHVQRGYVIGLGVSIIYVACLTCLFRSAT